MTFRALVPSSAQLAPARRRLGASVACQLRRLLVAILIAASVSCTLAQLTPQAKFNDAAYTLNDAARWNNVDVAMRYVAPTYSGRFAARHQNWGGTISVGEYDLVRLTMAPDKQTAVSEVLVSWYDQGGVRLHNSTITQRWEKTMNGYLLADETVRAGDTTLFADTSPGAATP